MKGLAVLFLLAGACLYGFPEFHRLFPSPSFFSSEEGHFVGSILGICGLVFLQFRKGEDSRRTTGMDCSDRTNEKTARRRPLSSADAGDQATRSAGPFCFRL